MTPTDIVNKMTPVLDAIDHKILALLLDNARMPVASIAKQVGVARTTAIARITSLEKKGVIAGYSVRLHRSTDPSVVRAYVGIAIDARHATNLANTLGQWPAVETLCAVSGSVDYMLTLCCHSTDELDRLLDQIGAIEGVRNTATSIILTQRIDRSRLDRASENSTEQSGK